MTKIFSRTLGVAAVVGAFALAAAAPASADPNPDPGDDIRVSQTASGNEGANSGNDGLLSNHNSGNGNSAANNIVDPSNVALVNTVKQLGGFLVL
ncbi:hypothetical protein AB0D33_05815 [Streptomyces sp. NPDC048404]|uniref:hypothetical protein n=1 Tax=unclassified Streptomyces TaxID=2593676 RepID=UPI0034486D68